MRYAKRPGAAITYRWLHPISIALYGFFFRSGGLEAHQAMAVRAITKGRDHAEILAVLREIEDELDSPTQEVRLILEGHQRSEEDCRAFLSSVVRQIKVKVGHDT